MKIEFWQQPNFQVPYGSLGVLRTDPGGLVAYIWDVADSQGKLAQDWISPKMLASPEPPPPPAPVPAPTRREILRDKAAAGTLTPAEIIEALKEVL